MESTTHLDNAPTTNASSEVVPSDENRTSVEKDGPNSPAVSNGASLPVEDDDPVPANVNVDKIRDTAASNADINPVSTNASSTSDALSTNTSSTATSDAVSTSVPQSLAEGEEEASIGDLAPAGSKDDDPDDDELEDGSGSGDKGKKKPGKKSDFKGKRLQYLKDSQDAYFQASASGKGGVSAWYTNVFFPAYFETFHWAVPWTRDSAKDPTKLPSMEDDELTATERSDKAAKTKVLKQKIKNWFNTNRNTVRASAGSSQAWNPWLKKLKEGCRVKPRKPQASQFYMHHTEFKEKVDAEYDRQWALSKKEKSSRMSTRYAIAKDLLSKEDDNVKARINRELEESHNRAMEEYQNGVWVSDTPEDRDDAIDSMTSVIQPLLDGIHEITGFHVGFFAAGARDVDGKPGKFDCLSMTAGACKATKKDLRDVDPQAFNNLIRTFTKIVVSASTKNGASSSSTEGHAPEHQATTPVPPTPSRYVSTPDPLSRRSLTSTRTQPPQATSQNPPTRQPVQSTAKARLRSEPAMPKSREEIMQDAMDAVKKTLDDGDRPNANEHLLRAIVKLKGQKKNDRITELLGMGEYEFERENNLARNRVLLAQIGVEGELESLLGSQVQSRAESPPRGDDADFTVSDFAEQQAANTTLSPRKTRSSTSGKPASSSTSRSSNKRSRDMVDDTSAEDAINNPPQTRPPTSTRSQGKPSSTRKKSSMTKREDWFELAWTTLHAEEKTELYGKVWVNILRLWEELERAEGYEENGLLLSTANRPKEVRLWIKSARPYHRIPSFNAVAYGKKWWLWWIANNPEWRVKTKDGKYLLAGGSGDWGDHLPATGLNGLLSVVAGLWLWRENISDVCPSLEDWEKALDDVQWVFTQLVAEAQEDEGAVEPPPKRVHRDD